VTAYRISTPISEADARKLRVGDVIYVSGQIVTARDLAHRRALTYMKQGKTLPFNIRDGVVYHCGPITRRDEGGWKVVAAGPTTSARLDDLEPEFLRGSGVRVIVGKGGMGGETGEALEEVGAVYCDFVGGAALLAAKSILRVDESHWLDLGLPEAVWILKVEDFGPLIVSMDSHGGNLRARRWMSIRSFP